MEKQLLQQTPTVLPDGPQQYVRFRTHLREYFKTLTGKCGRMKQRPHKDIWH